MMEPATLTEILARSAAARPDALAVRCGGVDTSYSELERRVRRTAAALASTGIKPADKVAVWLVNGVDWLALLLALGRLGACLVAVNTRFRSAELSYILAKSRARALVCAPSFGAIDFLAILQDIDPVALPDLEQVFLMGAGAGPAKVLGRPAARLDLDAAAGEAPDAAETGAPVAIFTSSGTTSAPKLVVHSHATLTGHSLAVARAMRLDRPDARLLAMLPLCGVFGLNGALAALSAGAPVVLMPIFEGLEAARLLRDEAITHTFGSDEMFRRLLAAAAGRYPFPAARLFGFAAFQAGARDLAIEAWGRRVPLYGVYGSSEVQALFSVQPADLPLEERIASGGRPCAAAAEVRIRDAETGDLLPPGASGEIEIRGPSRFLYYLGDEAATRRAILPNGFFRTGDIGRLRADGSFVFEGRMGDALRLGGFLVSPVEIEDVLKEIDGVAEAQVVGVSVDDGVVPVAFVIAGTPRRDADAILADAARRMAGFKLPKRLWFIGAFPTTMSPNGTKIQRGVLRDMARERLAAEPSP